MMPPSRAALIAEHRQIEAELDALSQSLAAGEPDLRAFRRASALCREYYPHEEEFLTALHPEAARKIASQHAEALEIAGHVEGLHADAVYLIRRFAAIVQHTIIEVERDLLPLDERR
jgi:hypothetical protein